jgi:hypothetical protein
MSDEELEAENKANSDVRYQLSAFLCTALPELGYINSEHSKIKGVWQLLK